MTPMREADLEQLYARLEKPVYNVVYRWVWNREEAQDIVQEAFVRLWRIRDRVVLTKAQPLVYRIALNLAASRLRRKKIWRWVTLDALKGAAQPGHDAAEAFEDAGERQKLRTAVDRLPVEMRTVIMLSEFSEMSYAEIAEALGVAPGTVASRRHRAIERLRSDLIDAETDSDEEARQSV